MHPLAVWCYHSHTQMSLLNLPLESRVSSTAISGRKKRRDETVMKGLNEPFSKRQNVCTSNKSCERGTRRSGFLMGRPLSTCKCFTPEKRRRKSFLPSHRLMWSVTVASLLSGCIQNPYQIKPGLKFTVKPIWLLNAVSFICFWSWHICSSPFSFVDAEAQSNRMSDICEQPSFEWFSMSKGSLNSNMTT